MIPKKFEIITFADIQTLVDASVAESKTLDYKRDLPDDSDSGKREFLSDIASFANASGGDMVIGLAEKKDADGKNTGTPEFFGLAQETNGDHEAQRLNNLIGSGIKPKIPQIQIKFLDGPTSKKIAVIRIPRSWAAPHMVTFKTTPSFYSRNSVGKQPLDVHEIHNAFLERETIAAKIGDFLRERIGRILADDLPCKMTGERRVVMHLVPIQSLDRAPSLDLAKVHDCQVQLNPIYSNYQNNRFNLHGLLITAEHGDQPQRSVVQVYRDGKIEAIESYLISKHKETGDIPYIALEAQLIKSLNQYLKYYVDAGVAAPVTLMLTLLNAKGGAIVIDRFFARDIHPIMEQHIFMPEVVIEDLTLPADLILRPLFDMIWNACGFEKCLSYDTDGRWKERRSG